jgi:hypothetical protein
MTTKCLDVLLSLYEAPRSVVHSRVSVRTKNGEEKENEDVTLEKMGEVMVSLTSLKEEPQTSR